MNYRQVLFNKMRISEDVLNKQPEEVQKNFKTIMQSGTLPETEALARAQAQAKIDELKFGGLYKDSPSKLVEIGLAIGAEKARQRKVMKEMSEKIKSLRQREKDIPPMKASNRRDYLERDYKKGGSVKSKKPRGVGAATRGYGKALTGRKK